MCNFAGKFKNDNKMKKKNSVMAAMLIVMSALSFVSCSKPESILVSSQELWFPLEAESQTITVTSNCDWSITLSDHADWYTITPMSGTKTDSVITISVKTFEGAGEFRASSFRVTSKHGHVFRTVVFSQNTLDFDGLVNKIFGITFDEQWDVDFYGQIIEDSYRSGEFDPYDTTQGYLMYFLEDGQGVQRDRHSDHAVYYPFTYEYNVGERNLHLDFETVDPSIVEVYDAEVLTASDSLYRVKHEYKPLRWERLDMRKVGTVTPGEKALLQKTFTKRKGDEPIVIF